MSIANPVNPPRDVIPSPVSLPEKSCSIDQARYTFIVDPRLNKTEIKLAIEKIFSAQLRRSTP
jgi:large subunit ribosomal protein L23